MESEDLLKNFKAILTFLPHRFPFLLIDRVVFVDDHTICGIKNVTFNEPMFAGHFPELPVYPGVYMIESSAQLAGIFLNHQNQNPDSMGYLAGIDQFEFKKTAHPGDQINIECQLLKKKMQVYLFHVIGKIDDSIAFQGNLKIIISQRK